MKAFRAEMRPIQVEYDDEERLVYITQINSCGDSEVIIITFDQVAMVAEWLQSIADEG